MYNSWGKAQWAIIKFAPEKGSLSIRARGFLGKTEWNQQPPRSAFYSKPNGTDISEKDYEHALTAWKEINCKTLRNYHDLYNVSDVLY